jgi:hypothetical protein
MIHLHIDRLVVEGLPASAEKRFVQALEAELRQLAKSGGANGGSALDALMGGSMRNVRKRVQAIDAGQLRPGATPEQAAARLVGSIRGRVSSPQTTRGGRANRNG